MNALEIEYRFLAPVSALPKTPLKRPQQGSRDPSPELPLTPSGDAGGRGLRRHARSEASTDGGECPRAAGPEATEMYGGPD